VIEVDIVNSGYHKLLAAAWHSGKSLAWRCGCKGWADHMMFADARHKDLLFIAASTRYDKPFNDWAISFDGPRNTDSSSVFDMWDIVNTRDKIVLFLNVSGALFLCSVTNE
jgi:hypothetical protein